MIGQQTPPPQAPPPYYLTVSYSYNIQKITWFELAMMSCTKICVYAWGVGVF